MEVDSAVIAGVDRLRTWEDVVAVARLDRPWEARPRTERSPEEAPPGQDLQDLVHVHTVEVPYPDRVQLVRDLGASEVPYSPVLPQHGVRSRMTFLHVHVRVSLFSMYGKHVILGSTLLAQKTRVAGGIRARGSCGCHVQVPYR